MDLFQLFQQFHSVEWSRVFALDVLLQIRRGELLLSNRVDLLKRRRVPQAAGTQRVCQI